MQFRYGESVQTITTTQGRASGVQLASGETIAAQAVVFNGDVAALRAGLLGGGALPQAVKGRPPERSLSAITWSINAPTSGFALERHNVFFQADYASEFSDIFGRARLPQLRPFHCVRLAHPSLPARLRRRSRSDQPVLPAHQPPPYLSDPQRLQEDQRSI